MITGAQLDLFCLIKSGELHYRLVTAYSSIKILMVNISFVPKQNCNFLISPSNSWLEGQISEAVTKVSTLQRTSSSFILLNEKPSRSQTFSQSPMWLDPLDNLRWKMLRKEIIILDGGKSQFMALQPKMITYENSVASFTTAIRFLTGPTALAASFIVIGLRGGLRHVDIVQWTTQRARLYAACLIITYLVISSAVHSVSRGTLFLLTFSIINKISILQGYSSLCNDASTNMVSLALTSSEYLIIKTIVYELRQIMASIAFTSYVKITGLVLQGTSQAD
ncbi:hypothetical protein F0562_027988 [Nyssa sinensis]|uniref:Uncharacterized protein n=1 Tax=Nyssa sinensis TaxID=561372 RepID=A0A5J5B810_9ASTE|nr:hypothetical protein F0562_027988 [Nyssa sinensis]